VSISSDRSRQISLQKEIAQIRSQIAQEREKLQRKNAEIGTIERSVNHNTSLSMLQSKQRQIEQKSREAATIEKKIGDLSKREASKASDVHRVQSSLETKENNARKKLIQDEKKRHTENDRALKKRATELARQARIHRSLSENPVLMRYEELPEKITVLFIASNPRDQAQLALDEEVRLIEQKIRASKFRDSVQIKSVWATRPSDLLQALNEHNPTVVHFSGHGSSQDELILQDDAGQAKPISKPAIVQMFNASSSGIRLIFFNTCFSSVQASEIVDYVPATIGMKDSIGDEAARVFAAQLYSAIGFGRSLNDSFEQAKAALMLEGIQEDQTPSLYLADSEDGDTVFLVRPHETSASS